MISLDNNARMDNSYIEVVLECLRRFERAVRHDDVAHHQATATKKPSDKLYADEERFF